MEITSEDLIKHQKEAKIEFKSDGIKSIYLKFNGSFEVYKKFEDKINRTSETKLVFVTNYAHKAAAFYNNLKT